MLVEKLILIMKTVIYTDNLLFRNSIIHGSLLPSDHVTSKGVSSDPAFVTAGNTGAKTC